MEPKSWHLQRSACERYGINFVIYETSLMRKVKSVSATDLALGLSGKLPVRECTQFPSENSAEIPFVTKCYL
jgi:hypothetical protein